MNNWEGIRKILELQRELSKHSSVFSSLKTAFDFKASLPDFTFYDQLATKDFGLASINYLMPAEHFRAQISDLIDPEIFANLKRTQESYEQMFAASKVMADNFNAARHYQFLAPQITSLSELFTGLAGKLSQLSEIEDDEDERDVLQSITERAAAISSELADKEYVTREDLLKFQKQIGDWLKVFAVKKFAGISYPMWTSIITTIIGIVTSVVFYLLPPAGAKDAVTKEDLRNFRKDLLADGAFLYQQNVISALVTVNSRLREKPVFSSRRLGPVAKGTVVQVLDSQGSWLYVTYISPMDELPISGWIPRSNLKRLHPNKGVPR